MWKSRLLSDNSQQPRIEYPDVYTQSEKSSTTFNALFANHRHVAPLCTETTGVTSSPQFRHATINLKFRICHPLNKGRMPPLIIKSVSRSHVPQLSWQHATLSPFNTCHKCRVSAIADFDTHVITIINKPL